MHRTSNWFKMVSKKHGIFTTCLQWSNTWIGFEMILGAMLTYSAEGSLPAWATATFPCGSTKSILAVSGASCHQQLWWLHLTLALLGVVRPAAVGKRNEKKSG